MGGYSCLRKSKLGIYKEAYGIITLPSAYAGTCPGDNDYSQVSKNIVPEIFFGLYTAMGGYDAGIRVTYGGGWRAFLYGNINICTDVDGTVFSSTIVKQATTLYMRTWIQAVGGKYYAKLNISKTSYAGTDLMSTPLSVEVDSSFGSTVLTSGAEINREITLAANPSSYETSNCYFNNAKWGNCGMVTPDSTTYIWTDANSMPWSGTGATSGGSGTKVLQLRKDYSATYDTRRIKVISATDTTSGANETVSIDFRSTPQI